MSSKSVSGVIKLKFCSPSVQIHDYFQLVCNSQGKKSSDKLWPSQNLAASDICSDFYSPLLPHTPFIQFVLLLFFFPLPGVTNSHCLRPKCLIFWFPDIFLMTSTMPGTQSKFTKYTFITSIKTESQCCLGYSLPEKWTLSAYVIK